jgi:hypothetical protein
VRFNKNVFTLQIPLKEGIVGEKRPKDRVTLKITCSILTMCYIGDDGFFLMGKGSSKNEVVKN